MNVFARRSLLFTLLLGAVARPAAADVAADVQTRIDGAMKTAKSYVVTTRYPAQAYSSTLVHVAPDRSRVVVAIAATTTDIVTVGDTAYSSKNGAPFEKAPVSADERARISSLGTVKVDAPHADVVVNGVAYGAFNTTVPLGAAVSLTCTYDKLTFRLARCTNAEVTQIYKNYDDPSNIVETPKDAVDAPKGTK